MVSTPEPVIFHWGGPSVYARSREPILAPGARPADLWRVVATHFRVDHGGSMLAWRNDAPEVALPVHWADAAAFAENREPGGDLAKPFRTHLRPDLARVDMPLIDGRRLDGMAPPTA